DAGPEEVVEAGQGPAPRSVAQQGGGTDRTGRASADGCGKQAQALKEGNDEARSSRVTAAQARFRAGRVFGRRRFIAAARARDRGARREGSGVYGIVSGDRVRRARRCALAGENSWRATRREAIRRARRPALREESGQPLLFLQDRALRP